MGRPIVGISRCTNPQDRAAVKLAVCRALQLIGGLDVLVGPDDLVLIKPNLVVPKDYTTGATTNPYVIVALIEALQDTGVRNIVVAESSQVGSNTDLCFEKTGVRALAERTGAQVVNLKRDEGQMVILGGSRKFRRLRIPATVLRADVMISVPVMKTHNDFAVSLSLKNTKGILFDEDKKRFHRRGLAEGIVDLNRAFLPDLVVTDGTVGMEGYGPIDGEPVELGLITASVDPVAADAVSCHIMGFDPNEVDYLALAAAAQLGTMDLARIDVAGEELSTIRRPFRRQVVRFEDYERFKVVERGACSSCRHMMTALVTELERDGRLELLDDYTFVLGQSVACPERPWSTRPLVLLGACLARHRTVGLFAPGCPPSAGRVRQLLMSDRQSRNEGR